MYNFYKTGRRHYKSIPVQNALDNFFARHRNKANFHIVHLWENWDMVMGEYLTKVALPLGSKEKTLLIGTEDNMLMHELSFYTPEILGRANAFMREEYFDKVHLSPLQGRVPLYPFPATPGSGQRPDERPRPENLGKLILDPSTPVGKAYTSYVKSFEP
ncbi:MAG: DUF721 domain-containing protein [Deltaproteobacteria bacterium]|jgi:hypothetical protein|nr:DUF721 domain-containing protein [Deltaproteobacteria bacterium]